MSIVVDVWWSLNAAVSRVLDTFKYGSGVRKKFYCVFMAIYQVSVSRYDFGSVSIHIAASKYRCAPVNRDSPIDFQ